MSNKPSLIRKIYLYLFSIVGLTLLIIGGIRFIDMGLRAFVFKKADAEKRLIYKRPPFPEPLVENLSNKIDQSKNGEEKIFLSNEELDQVKKIIYDYQSWQKQKDAVDPITASRQRDASINLAMILIGLPLYLYHWGLIKKETKA